jgi:hypothetical protein
MKCLIMPRWVIPFSTANTGVYVEKKKKFFLSSVIGKLVNGGLHTFLHQTFYSLVQTDLLDQELLTQ